MAEPPPYQCDPEIVGNAEGDKRALAKDKAAVAAKRGERPWRNAATSS